MRLPRQAGFSPAFVHPLQQPAQFVHERIAGDYLEALKDGIERVRVGMPWEKGVRITPLADPDRLPPPWRAAPLPETPSVLASRGCPHSCSFCCNHALRKRYAGKGVYFRFNSVDRVLDRLAGIVIRYGPACFTFVDDVFGLNREWAMEFCRKYPRRFHQGFKCNLRADQVDAELLREVAQRGGLDLPEPVLRMSCVR